PRGAGGRFRRSGSAPCSASGSIFRRTIPRSKWWRTWWAGSSPTASRAAAWCRRRAGGWDDKGAFRMTARAAFLLGLCLVLAALVHGGFYAAGHDFVVNRFTGRFQFVPAEDEDEANSPVRSVPALTSCRPEARVHRPKPRAG